MPTFIRNVRRVTRSSSRRCSCSSGLGGGSFSSIGVPSLCVHLRVLVGLGGPVAGGRFGLSFARQFRSRLRIRIRLPRRRGPLRNQPRAHVGDLVVRHRAARNVVAPVGLADIGPSRNDRRAHRLLIDQREKRPIQDRAGASAVLCVFAVAARAGHRVDRLPFGRIARHAPLCTAAEFCPASALSFFHRARMPCTIASICASVSGASALRTEAGHQRSLFAVGNHIAQRCIVDQRLVLGIGEIGRRAVVAVLAVAPGAILAIQLVERSHRLRPRHFRPGCGRPGRSQPVSSRRNTSPAMPANMRRALMAWALSCRLAVVMFAMQAGVSTPEPHGKRHLLEPFEMAQLRPPYTRPPGRRSPAMPRTTTSRCGRRETDS